MLHSAMIKADSDSLMSLELEELTEAGDLKTIGGGEEIVHDDRMAYYSSRDTNITLQVNTALLAPVLITS